MKEAIDSGIVTRSDLFITTKLWNTYHRSERVSYACEKSLEALSATGLTNDNVGFEIGLFRLLFNSLACGLYLKRLRLIQIGI